MQLKKSKKLKKYMNMKKKIFIIAALCGMFLSSCQDMLETDSDRQIFDPELNEKTDSMFYTLGILKGVQQAIDQYVLVNEMRGDLTQVNQYTESDLRALANFSATAENKYDSAYVFYRIINNCNYFIAHRDTTLLTGSRKVAIPEYVQAHSIRAWAYLQLAKIYGSVPFYTDPITNISDANVVRDKKDIRGICDALAPELAKYSGQPVPTYGNNIEVGETNRGRMKIIADTRYMMFPVDLVLGDLYLEAGDYAQAAHYYFTYLHDTQTPMLPYYNEPAFTAEILRKLPNDMRYNFGNGIDWMDNFSMNSPSGMITYVPMAVNKLNGLTSDLPRLFGYDFYTTESSYTLAGGNVVSSLYLLEREIDASQSYLDLANAQTYYYVPSTALTDNNNVKSVDIGDLRRYSTLSSHISKEDSIFYEMTKYEGANIPIYRTATVYLRLAEAINRMGYPDVAFAILKDGLNRELATSGLYLSAESYEFLRTTIPFFSDENISNFTLNTGVHSFGSGYTRGAFSPYQLDSEMDRKVAELNAKYGEDFIKPIYTTVEVFDEEGNPVLDEEGNPVTEVVKSWQKQDLINVVEDLICDEYALELAFEGNRFGDLCRIARHKNDAGTYGSDYGSRWLADKLAYKHPAVDLTNPQNWYMPFSK